MAFAVLVGGKQAHAQNLERDFANLMERCRASIEKSIEFDSQGLQPHSVATKYKRDWGAQSQQTAWIVPDSVMHVVVTEWTSVDGQVRHLCDVGLSNEERVLDKSEQGLLLRHFLVTQSHLIGAGTHVIAEGLSPIPPLINAGFLLKEKNPNGCSVITSFTISPDGAFFSATTGEQATKECDGG